jgi:predicted DNA-binding protein
MQRMSVHIPDNIRKRIKRVAIAKSKAEAAVIREALEEGLDGAYPKSSSAQALVELVKQAEKIPTQGKIPADFVKNLDYYTWGGEKRE